jgi:hypothetical protein
VKHIFSFWNKSGRENSSWITVKRHFDNRTYETKKQVSRTGWKGISNWILRRETKFSKFELLQQVWLFFIFFRFSLQNLFLNKTLFYFHICLNKKSITTSLLFVRPMFSKIPILHIPWSSDYNESHIFLSNSHSELNFLLNSSSFEVLDN